MNETRGSWERRTGWVDNSYIGTWNKGYNAALDACRPEYDAVVAERDAWRFAAEDLAAALKKARAIAPTFPEQVIAIERFDALVDTEDHS